MSIGILTSGGDCSGLNAVIRGAVLKGVRVHGQEFMAVRDGWHGLLTDNISRLKRRHVRGISRRGGTILGTSRTNPQHLGGPERIKAVMAKRGIDSLIAIGGEGTLNGARELHEAGIKLVGVPKTIDNDLAATDYTFGFDTAVAVATESIDRIRDTADSHHRCMVIEVMGRHAGWIALHAGMAAGAHAILIPEVPVSLGDLKGWVKHTLDRNRAPVVVVAEGFQLRGEDGEINDLTAERGMDAAGRRRLGGIAEALAPMIEGALGVESRAVTLGHLQRGGTPTAYDRLLATRFGTAAVDALVAENYGSMVSLDGMEIRTVPLADATKGIKSVPRAKWEEAAVLFG